MNKLSGKIVYMDYFIPHKPGILDVIPIVWNILFFNGSLSLSSRLEDNDSWFLPSKEIVSFSLLEIHDESKTPNPSHSSLLPTSSLTRELTAVLFRFVFLRMPLAATSSTFSFFHLIFLASEINFKKN